MEVIIRFIGLVMLYQSPSANHAIIPQWTEGYARCDFTVQKHRPYIRVSKWVVVDDSKWKKEGDCDPGLDCVFYLIPDGTTLSIDLPAAVTASAKEEIPCFIPDLEKEHLVDDAVLHPDALTTRSSTDYVLPPGRLEARQFANDQIYLLARIPVASARAPLPTRIVATPRPGSSATLKELKVRAGATVDLIHVPPSHAQMDYNTFAHDMHSALELELKGHIFLMHKLLENPVGCGLIADVSPEGCEPHVRNHFTDTGLSSTQDIGCGPTSMSGPDITRPTSRRLGVKK